MQAPSTSTDKGKQKARDPQDAAQAMDEAGSSRVVEPIIIPSRTTQTTDAALSQSPPSSSSHNDHDRRPSHARAKSSLGSVNTFDFFGPSSLASNSTAATSFHFGSPEDSSKPKAVARPVDAHDDDDDELRSSLERTIDAVESRIASGEPVLQQTQQRSEEAANEAFPPESTAEEPVEERTLGVPSAPRPPLYPEETLPSYEEAPEYTPPMSQSAASGSRSKTSAFRAAAANRFLSSRIAKRLNLPPALQSRLQGTQTPDASPSSQAYTSQPLAGHLSERACFVRSDSAPNLSQSVHAHGRRRIEVRNYAATAYMDGAVMGPAPRSPRPSSSRPSTAGAESPRSRPNAIPFARPSSGNGVPSGDQRRLGASPLLRTAVSSVNSSRRNSGESRPPSRATISSAPNGGLFTCGYAQSRSGATTPTRPSLLRKGRSRTVSLRSLGDLLSLNRDRDRASGPSDDSSERDLQQADESASTGTIVREVVSPVSQELLISARVRTAPTARPTLMNAAHSSPRAGVDSAASGNPVLILPHQSYERKPDPLAQLPRELVLTIFKSLVDLHIEEHTKAVKDGLWRGKRSSQTRWVGMEAAVRELARLSRVSRAWQSFVLDGQLWQNLEFSKYPDMTEEAMVNIARAVGPFVRRLDLQGLAGLRSSVLLAISKAQRPRPLTSWELSTSTSFITRQLEELNLQGCRRISTSALNTVLSQSPNLKHCKLASLPCVDNTTLCVLAATATNLETLDISRCRSIDADGVRAIFAIQESETNISAVSKERNVGSRFRELRAAGVAGFDSATLAQLGRHWPNLEVLDLSYCSDVDDAAIAALVSSEGDTVSEKGHFVTLTPRQAGSQLDDEVVRRRFPHLKKLNLSSCRALSDRACISLAHAVPMLEVLEMANIGAALKDAGLVKLFATTPQLQKLDLERATQITDAVVSALTPPESHAEAFGLAVPDRDTLMHGTRPRGSLLNMARRSASRRRHANQSASTASVQDEALPTYDEQAVAALIPVTGTHLTHLILSSANRLTAEAMLLLINRCPFLVHLELDGTHADNEVAMQFVQLARYRKVRDAYLCLVDCRSFSRDAYSQLSHGDAADGGVRPRRGSRGYAFRQFRYDDPEPCYAVAAGVAASERGEEGHGGRSSTEGREWERERDGRHDECNELKPVVKSFWGWQLVDARMKQLRKAEQRAAALRRHQGGRSKVTSVVAMALGLPAAAVAGGDEVGGSARQRGGGANRWSRMLLGAEAAREDARRDEEEEDVEDDARGCVVM
ncbi:uncharacterized protein SRS1_11866 [Sporisorium reilianum f. sp. reilianum]|uniref:F-box domain-containing protein n=1 Tax=Sporisorium reilianum f. sp. reilianum TaxID=72559 RepID=A0A2N8U7I0_9BASI|nr:uncharacterized protein SRS1_11866 [Sporisorium reilianum f. sp. reilianum]